MGKREEEDQYRFSFIADMDRDADPKINPYKLKHCFQSKIKKEDYSHGSEKTKR